MQYIYNGKILFKGKVLHNKAIIFSDKIEKIVEADSATLRNLVGIDAKGKYISAGFIDIHIHGYAGFDTMDGTGQAITKIAEGIAANGVTAFLPTTMSMPKAAIERALNAIQEVRKTQSSGAEVLGAHLEGPYFNLKYMGAQNPDYIVNPTVSDAEFIKKYIDIIKLVSVAPEVDGAIDLINAIKADVAISMGHTAATFTEAIAGINAGISSATHLFNAMSPLHHRDPGVVGAAMITNIFCEMICDCVHVDPALFELISKLKSPDKLILITDSISAGGCVDGEYSLGGQKVIVSGGSARLESGALAGSVLKLNKALYNIISNSNFTIETAINFVTTNPAKLIGVDNFKGSLEPGKDADIVIFDNVVNIARTICKGNVIY
ncbi:N-acetylglucosamine-6-phosphate deacetylase [Candidatus Epulonipiscium viviparus]|uniref:N-acetylglucosamine-6-phosphate deacetylase n=1 Tax=Candidatus Epulonipiscium viviparus TaxID=420336 RepID=UPI0027380A58|nr:N-acetylglucosamine-6-phosphate deacetylase [Candidatus Epulopiscium viviparus]